MKIVFVVMSVENLGVEFLSSFLKKYDYEVEVVFDPRLFTTEALVLKRLAKVFDMTKEIVDQMNERKPDLLGFSVFTLNYQRSLELAREFKKSNKETPIIFGGIHPTSVPEIVIKEKCVDMVCVGEGENALLELLESMKSKKPKFDIKNLWFKKGNKIIKNFCRPPIEKLDSLPYPDKDLFYKIYPGFINYDYFTISSRGCPFACTYCANNTLRKIYQNKGMLIRRRSPENVVNELVWAKKRFKIKRVTFVDDIFVEDINWLKKFASDYKERVNLPYVMITHPLFMNPRIIKLLVKSGCYFLLFGIQSVSEKTRKEILKRFETNKDIEQAAKACHRAHLKFSVDHIFDIPGEEIEEQIEAMKFYNRIRPSIINSYRLQYFPKAEIIKTAITKGVIKKRMIKKIERGLTSSSYVIGLGGKNSFNSDLIYENFQFMLTILPILPKWLIDKIIKKRLYLLKIKSPLFINIILKFFVNLLNKRASIYLGIIKQLLYFIKVNLYQKWVFLKNS